MNGYISPMHITAYTAGIITSAGMLCGCVIPDTSSKSTPRASYSMPSPATDVAEPATDGAASSGSAVHDGKFEFRVVGVSRAATVSDPTGNPFMTVTAQGEFVVVTLSVSNIGNVPQSYFGQNQKLIDASGREYGANSEADTYMNDAAFGDINPGNSIQVRVAFDVPPGTSPAELELHDSMFVGRGVGPPGVTAIRRAPNTGRAASGGCGHEARHRCDVFKSTTLAAVRDVTEGNQKWQIRTHL